MDTTAAELSNRLDQLERKLRTTRLALMLVAMIGIGFGMLGLRDEPPAKPTASDEIRTRRLVVVDDADVPRVIITQDAEVAGRRDRAAGISIHDKHGNERGGFSTFDDGSVVFAMDAPRGVGDPMPDRLGLSVNAQGGAQILLIDNETRGVAGMYSDGKGGGGLQLFKWDTDGKKIHLKTVAYDGENVQMFPLGEKE